MENQQSEGIVLPTAPDAEAAILACIIEDPKRFSSKAWESQIGSEYFHSQPNSSLFRILMDRIRDQQPVDPSSIREDIRRMKPEGLAVSDLLAILNHEKSTDGWDGYMHAVRDAHARRVILTAASESSGMQGREALDLLRKAAETASGVLEGTAAVSDAKKASQIFLDAFTERFQNGEQPGVSTGIDKLDEHTGGMRKGELWVIGAKTSGGKSILMIQMAAAAINDGKRVAIFTLELGTDEVVGRLLSCMHYIPISQIMNPKTVTKWYFDKITTAT